MRMMKEIDKSTSLDNTGTKGKMTLGKYTFDNIWFDAMRLVAEALRELEKYVHGIIARHEKTG